MQDEDKAAKDHRSKSTLFSNDSKQTSRAQGDGNMCDRSCNLGSVGSVRATAGWHWPATLRKICANFLIAGSVVSNSL